MPSRAHGYDFDGGGDSGSSSVGSSRTNPFSQFSSPPSAKTEDGGSKPPCRTCTDFKTWLKTTRKNKDNDNEDGEDLDSK